MSRYVEVFCVLSLGAVILSVNPTSDQYELAANFASKLDLVSKLNNYVILLACLGGDQA